MKKIYLLTLLFCGLCFSCAQQKQKAQESQQDTLIDSTKTDKNMTNEQLKEKLELALNDMKAKAIEMNIDGPYTSWWRGLDRRDEGCGLVL